jgi:hypothetical protein
MDSLRLIVVLGTRQAQATHVHSFHLINAISATISSAQAARLLQTSAVAAVVPDAVRDERRRSGPTRGRGKDQGRRHRERGV